MMQLFQTMAFTLLCRRRLPNLSLTADVPHTGHRSRRESPVTFILSCKWNIYLELPG
jgi:hypothetical protein